MRNSAEIVTPTYTELVEHKVGQLYVESFGSAYRFIRARKVSSALILGYQQSMTSEDPTLFIYRIEEGCEEFGSIEPVSEEWNWRASVKELDETVALLLDHARLEKGI